MAIVSLYQKGEKYNMTTLKDYVLQERHDLETKGEVALCDYDGGATLEMGTPEKMLPFFTRCKYRNSEVLYIDERKYLGTRYTAGGTKKKNILFITIKTD